MTTNPWLIMLINMTVVFGVLILLGVLMHIIYLVDPTKKKPQKPEVAPAAPAPVSTAAPAVAPSNDEEIVAVIAAAISALGYSTSQIASVRPVISQGWKLDGRLNGRM